LQELHRVSKNNPLLFLNNSVELWPFLIIFGTRHREKSRRYQLWFCPVRLNAVTILPCEMQNRSLALYNIIEFILNSTRISSKRINWMAINTSKSYYFLTVKRITKSHHIIFITACVQNIFLQHEHKRLTLT